MDERPLAENRVAIIGLGLMGGSLAMALHGKCKALYGIDPDPETLRIAQSLSIFERTDGQPAAGLSEADVIVLAAPVGAILELIAQLPDYHQGEAVVIDIGSTKREIMSAFQQLPPRFVPVGGHPMCGKETAGITNADPSLFDGAPFALTRLPRTTQQAGDLAVQIAEAVSARPFWIDAETHDRWAAAVSHLPFLLSLSLALVTPPDAGPLVGPGFKSVVRLAGKPASMMVDILKTNREEILFACTQFTAQLDALQRLIEESAFEEIAGLSEVGRIKRETLVGGKK